MKISLLLIIFFITLQPFPMLLMAQDEQKVELYVQTGHTSLIQSSAFSPDGRIIASGSLDNTIKLWDVSSGDELKTLLGHTSSLPIGVTAVEFSPDGKTIISSGGDCNIRFWDVLSGRELKVLPTDSKSAQCSGSINVILSPDGTKLASTSGNNTFKLWDVSTGRELRTFSGHIDTISALAFSPDSKTLASAGAFNDKTIKLWDVATGREINTLVGATQGIQSMAFSPDGKILCSTGDKYNGIIVWDVSRGQILTTFFGHTDFVASLAFSPDGKILASGGGIADLSVKLWDITNGQVLRSLPQSSTTFSVRFLQDGKVLATSGNGNGITLWDIVRGIPLKTLSSHSVISYPFEFSPDGKILAWIDKSNISLKDGILSGSNIKLLDITAGLKLKTLVGHTNEVLHLAFSQDSKTLASGGDDKTVRLWDVSSGRELNRISVSDPVAFGQELNRISVADRVAYIVFSLDGKYLITGTVGNTTKLWEVASGKELKSFQDTFPVALSPDRRMIASIGRLFGGGEAPQNIIYLFDLYSGAQKILRGHSDKVYRVDFSPNGKILISASYDRTRRLWDVGSGQEIKSFQMGDRDADREITNLLPNYYQRKDFIELPRAEGKFQIRLGENGKINWYEAESGKLLFSLVALDENDLVVTTPEGRFDTNKSLDRIEGLHWIVNNEILKPLPLDVFMRQYYEPGLLQRVMAGEKLKPLPSIADINRVQPRVAIKEIKSSANSTDSVDVTVDIENVIEDVSISATDRTKKKQLTSGAYDLRLFRDGQLVGVSTPKEKLAAFINDAPRLIAETKASGKLIDTPEDHAWREANDIFKLKSENINVISPDKVQYTFRNIKLPHDRRKEVEFMAYAFNSDKVKSATTEPFKFPVPIAVANTPKKGRAFLISIGVNASENPAYDLRYAVNDARKMQEIVGARLKADKDKYSEVIQIPLISDYGADKQLTENTAQKAIIKGVFSLLAGHENEVPPDVLKRIPNRDKIKAVEPEDTLIIAYSGHGYADQSGIFYLLPYDIGANTRKLTPEALQKTISSDELSLWMQDITAAEMIMIIDACHSSAAVQGDGFKPAPMGSRGLGQLAYDKDMKILSATQADNIALEAKNLGQGLLSYVLLEDGINLALADADKDKKLFDDEWLSFAEMRVPELYQEARNGKRDVIIDGRNVKGDGTRDTLELEENQNLQSPHLFNFKRRRARDILFNLQ
jgi:WD40 repeat protein/uncharacterized caspase-like protein